MKEETDDAKSKYQEEYWYLVSTTAFVRGQKIHGKHMLIHVGC
jgi:hypothetical protein